MLLNKGTLQSGSKGEAPAVEEFAAGVSTSQMRAWTLRKQLVSQRSRRLLHLSK